MQSPKDMLSGTCELWVQGCGFYYDIVSHNSHRKFRKNSESCCQGSQTKQDDAH